MTWRVTFYFHGLICYMHFCDSIQSIIFFQNVWIIYVIRGLYFPTEQCGRPPKLITPTKLSLLWSTEESHHFCNCNLTSPLWCPVKSTEPNKKLHQSGVSVYQRARNEKASKIDTANKRFQLRSALFSRQVRYDIRSGIVLTWVSLLGGNIPLFRMIRAV